MHMADALLSPAVGGSLWLASGATLAWCSGRVTKDSRDHLVPLMGVLGAFVFAAQMINFTIPATGSSGHIGGGLLLAILLGPYAAFVVIASILTMQALFFADGGLLALGANIFNLGVFPCLVAYPFIYRPLLASSGSSPSRSRLGLVTVLAAVVGLQLGALGVVVETRLSDISDLPLGLFLLLMQPIHLAIGLVEGFATAALVLFVYKSRPDIVAGLEASPAAARRFPRGLIALFAAMAALTGGVFSWFASTQPDGLEWSLAKATGQPELPAPQSALHERMADLQKRVAPMPDYKLPMTAEGEADAAPEAWPAVDPATSVSGLAGGIGTLALIVAIGGLLRRKASAEPTRPDQATH
jgi:cobalt/nickel transport system permease protein